MTATEDERARQLVERGQDEGWLTMGLAYTRLEAAIAAELAEVRRKEAVWWAKAVMAAPVPVGTCKEHLRELGVDI